MNALLIWDEAQGKYVPIPAVQGPPGPPGPAYTLTEADKESIVSAVLAALPDGTEVAY